MTVEQKLTKAMIDLRKIFPYYSGIYEILEKEPSFEVEIIGVSLKKITYHPEKFEQMPQGEVLFWVLHAVAHLALEHITRGGGRTPELWNLACDFYVNKWIAEEFSLVGPHDEVKLRGVSLIMPEDAIFHRDLNLKTHSVEYIYKKLKSSTKEEPSAPDPHEKSATEEHWKNQWEGERGTHPTCSHSRDFLDNDDPEEDEENKFQTFLVEEGEKLVSHNDLLDIPEQWGNLNSERLGDKLRAEASMKGELNQDQPMQKIEGAKLEPPPQSEIGFVDWRKLLRRYLSGENHWDCSFSTPDKRFIHQKLILPGPTSSQGNQLSGLKICLDTSGSVSEEDLQSFLGQIWNICKGFHLDAELIYWDAQIQGQLKFRGKQDLLSYRPQIGKGTDPDCLFRYFESKQCKIQPLVCLIFTDGYFSSGYGTPNRKRRYPHTIWVMTKDYNPQFSPPFGKVAIPQFHNS
ncbi:MAG: VWA-like domain-containing protein [Eubacteriales bacterium]